MVQVSAEEAKTRLPDLIADAIRGESVFITQDGQQVIQLVPVGDAIGDVKLPRQPGSAEGLIWMADDFDAPLEDFKEYIE
jgi:antitoxin (DNA-binding transcriptional repressor) of toxin-antitoxin stability system